jgi:hypothetical protein
MTNRRMRRGGWGKVVDWSVEESENNSGEELSNTGRERDSERREKKVRIVRKYLKKMDSKKEKQNERGEYRMITGGGKGKNRRKKLGKR